MADMDELFARLMAVWTRDVRPHGPGGLVPLEDGAGFAVRDAAGRRGYRRPETGETVWIEEGDDA